jgi:hypothetical protein
VNYLTLLVVVFIVLIVLGALHSARMTPEQRAQVEWGDLNEHLICPHCQSKGTVRTKGVKRKKGISGAKATGALLTAGVSILATGLSRKESETCAHCMTCGSTWHF